MDYGDGHLNGVYQFNTKYRKAEMCAKMAKHVGKCHGKFAAMGNLSNTSWGGDGRPSTPASQEEKKSADSIQGMSETVKGEPVPLSLHWKCVMVATASLGVVLLGAEIWAVGRALRRPPQLPNTNIDEQNERCWLMSEVGC